MTPHRTRRAALLVTTALAVTVLAGCGSMFEVDTQGGSSVAEETRRSEPTQRSTPATPEATPTPSEPAPSEASADTGEQPTTSPASPATLPARLLSAEELPGLDASFRWSEGRTTKSEPATLAGTCHRFSMLSIGAMRVAHRDYLPADAAPGATANSLVAAFADAKTAWRAFEVLKSWRADCDEVLAKFDHHQVGNLRPVSVDGGDGGWYLLRYGPAEGDRDADYIDAEGIALVGKHVVVVRMAVIGKRYDYPAGQEPIAAAVRAAAAKLH